MIFRSIKTRLVWSHLLAIILINGVLGTMSYSFIARSLIRNERQTLEFIVNHTGDMLRDHVINKAKSLKQVATSRLVADYLQSYRDLALAQYLAGFAKEFPTLSLVNAQGYEEVTVKNGANSEVAHSPYNETFLERSHSHPNEVEIFFDNELHGRHTSHIYLALSSYGYFGDQFQGTLLAALPFRDLLHQVGSTHIHSGGFLVLWGDDQDDIYIQGSQEGHSHHADDILRIASYNEDGRFFHRLAEDKTPFQNTTVLGVESMVTFVHLPELGINLLATLPSKAINSQLQQLRNRALATFAALCLLAVGLSYLMARGITRPIRHLTEVTRKIATGCVNTEGLAGMANRRDEVATLVSSFQTMMDNLRTTMVSRDYVDKIFAAMTESIVVVAENGKIRRVNSSACNLLGYSEEELLKLSIADILDEKYENADLVGRLLKQEQWQETAYRHRKGHSIPVLFSCSGLVRHDGSEETVCVASDITGQKKAREALEENQHYLKALMRSLPSGLLVIDADNRVIIDANPTACLILQRSKEQVVGQVCFEVIKPARPQAQWPPTVSPDRPIINMECQIVLLDGATVPVSMSVQAIRLRDTTVYINSFVDITESKKTMEALQESEKKLRNLAISDELTGLMNRRGFFTLVEKQLQIANRNQSPVYLLYADIDNLKEVNDSLGHSAGDELICRAAEVLNSVCRQSDIIGRLGGDEFAVLLTGADDEEAIIRRLEDKIVEVNSRDTTACALSLSVGVVSCQNTDPDSTCLLDAILSAADAKMYVIKKQRREEKALPA